MERVAPVVDETIRALAKSKFIEDPIAGVRYSRNTSIVSSAYKRHGRILEIALRESLRDSNRHKVDILKACQSWYFFLFQQSGWKFVAGMAALMFLPMMAVGSLSYLFWIRMPHLKSSVLFPISIVATLIFCYLIGRSALLLFPKIVFDFGKSASIGRRAAFWRNVTGTGILLALLVGVVGGLIVEKIK
jgi:hypothetical protein